MSEQPKHVRHGIEALIENAAADPEFRKALLEGRGEAAQTIGIVLSQAETAMLAAIPREQLERMIDKVNEVASPAAKSGRGSSCLVESAVIVAIVAALSSISVGARPDRDFKRPQNLDRDPPAVEAPADATTPRPTVADGTETTSATADQSPTTLTVTRPPGMITGDHDNTPPSEEHRQP